jgi:hypothetical protein
MHISYISLFQTSVVGFVNSTDMFTHPLISDRVICLFNDSVSNLVYIPTTSSDRLISEQKIPEDVEDSGLGLILTLIPSNLCSVGHGS